MSKNVWVQPAILQTGMPAGFCGEWKMTGSPGDALRILKSLPMDSLVVGLGASLLDLFGERIPGLLPFRARHAQKNMPATPQDLWTLLTRSNDSDLHDAIQDLRKRLAPAFTLVEAQSLFKFRDGRELGGHMDGTENPTGDAIMECVALADGDRVGGTFAIVQRYVYLDNVLEAMSGHEVNHAFGRDQESDEELEDAADDAHIKRVDQDIDEIGGDILRRSMPFSTGMRRGLQFFAFCNDVDRFDRMLDRMVGIDGPSDAILQFCQAETGAYYFCPSVDGLRMALGFVEAAGLEREDGGPGDPVERAVGPEADLLFEGKRCIHSRQCVLRRPDVFVPNIQGEWIHPERATGPEVAEIARNCPSGAIRFEAKSGVSDELPPPINHLRVREDGPYEVRADMTIRGRRREFRATLCRCGQSKNKPYCDGSHHEAGFAATGEPKERPSPMLDERGGELTIDPIANGPLAVAGPMEICGASGKTIFRAKRVVLCRCGQSADKPFCDGTHASVGFVAP